MTECERCFHAIAAAMQKFVIGMTRRQQSVMHLALEEVIAACHAMCVYLEQKMKEQSHD